MGQRKINIGLIGCGYWGPNFVRIINQSDVATLTRICDTHEDRLNTLRESNPEILFTLELNDVINDPLIQAVIICTPVNTHYTIVKKALQSGKHVLCEKPLTDNPAHCQRLKELSLQNGLVLMTGHVYEFNPVMQYIKRMIREDQLGQILYMQFSRMGLGPVRRDVNVIFDLAPHDVAIAMSLMNQLPVSVSAKGSSFLHPKIEDVAFILLEFPNSIMASIGVSWLDPIKQRVIKVVGSSKMVIFDDISIGEKLRIIETGKGYQTDSGDFGRFQLSVKDGEIIIPNIPQSEPLLNEFNHFIDCIRRSVTPITGIDYAAQAVAVLAAAQQSLKHDGKRVYL